MFVENEEASKLVSPGLSVLFSYSRFIFGWKCLYSRVYSKSASVCMLSGWLSQCLFLNYKLVSPKHVHSRMSDLLLFFLPLLLFLSSSVFFFSFFLLSSFSLLLLLFFTLLLLLLLFILVPSSSLFSLHDCRVFHPFIRVPNGTMYPTPCLCPLQLPSPWRQCYTRTATYFSAAANTPYPASWHLPGLLPFLRPVISCLLSRWLLPSGRASSPSPVKGQVDEGLCSNSLVSSFVATYSCPFLCGGCCCSSGLSSVLLGDLYVYCFVS